MITSAGAVRGSCLAYYPVSIRGPTHDIYPPATRAPQGLEEDRPAQVPEVPRNLNASTPQRGLPGTVPSLWLEESCLHWKTLPPPLALRPIAGSHSERGRCKDRTCLSCAVPSKVLPVRPFHDTEEEVILGPRRSY